MSLFKIPKRQESNIQEIIIKTQEEYKPKIKLKGTSLLDKLSAINRVVKDRLGEDAENYLLLDSDDKFLDYCKKALDSEYIALDTETDSLDNMLANLAGVCIMSENQRPAYAPVGHISAITETLVPNQVSKEAIVKGLQLLIDANKKFIFHNSYFDIIELYTSCGIRVPVWFDTLPAGHILNENEQHGLKYLYGKYCTDGKAGVTRFADLFEGIPITYIKPDIAKIYSAHDAEMTMDLFKFQYKYLCPDCRECREFDLTRLANLFWNESMPMIDVLVDMKLKGMDFDFEQAEKLREKYTNLLEEAKVRFIEACKPIKKQIEAYNETHFSKPVEFPPNYNSSDQMRIIFYDILKIGTVYRKDPRGTGKVVIEAILASERLKDSPIIPIVKALNEVKMYDKAINSFIIKLTDTAKVHNGKIHANINLCGTRTGRLSSSEPNMQQCSSKLGDIRLMFKAPKDYVMVSCDFSKQEPCILASASNDHKLIKTFNDGIDIYSVIASMAFNCPYEDCLEHYPDGSTNKEGKKRRTVAKKIVLSIMYSKGMKTLSEELGFTMEKTTEIFNSVLGAYPEMAKWMKERVDSAFKLGYTENIFGRKRRLPDLLLPKYEVILPKTLDEDVIKYYKALYVGKLNKARTKEEQDLIVQEARMKNITIHLNDGKIAKSQREIVNFNIQGCICGDSFIITKEHGLVHIEDVATQQVTIWDGNKFVNAFCVPSGKKQLVKIKFYDGRVIKCSPEHKFLFRNVRGGLSFKTAFDLYQMGGNVKMIVSSDNTSDFENLHNSYFPELCPSVAFNSNIYSFDMIEDRFELGYLLGWLHCDGSVNRGRVCCWFIAENKNAILPFIESILAKYFCYSKIVKSAEEVQKRKPTLKISEGMTRLIVYSKTLAHQAKELGIKNKVPEVLLKSKEAMRGYIQACLDSDGTVNERNVIFSFGHKHFYKELTEVLQQMLSVFGILSRIHFCDDRINICVMKKDVQKFYNLIGARHPKKLERMKNIHKELKHPEYAMTTRIESIEVTDEYVDMYDIVDSESHQFVVNGVISHNSAASITLRAMLNIAHNKRLKELGAYMVMSIHD